MRFRGDGAQRHGAGRKALDDVLGGLDFIERDRLGGIELEFEQAPQGQVAAGLVVDELGVFFVAIKIVGAGRMLQFRDGVRRPHVVFAAHAVGILAARVERLGQQGVLAKGQLVQAQRFFRHFEHADAFHARGRAAEVFVDQGLVQAHRFENLRAAVGHVGGDAHLRHHLQQALADGLGVVINRLFGGHVLAQAGGQFGQGFHGQIRVDGLGAKAGQQGEMVGLAGRARFHHQAGGGAQAAADQVLVDGRGGQQGGNGDLGARHGAVRHDQDIVARFTASTASAHSEASEASMPSLPQATG